MTKQSHLFKEAGNEYKKHYFYSQLYLNQMSNKNNNKNMSNPLKILKI